MGHHAFHYDKVLDFSSFSQVKSLSFHAFDFFFVTVPTARLDGAHVFAPLADTRAAVLCTISTQWKVPGKQETQSSAGEAPQQVT